jgi:oligopeptide transport system ATP-binding protein
VTGTVHDAPAPHNGAPSPLFYVDDLSVTFHKRGRLSAGAAAVKAVDGVSFEMGVGEALGLVGESGSGKSSIARAMVRVVPSRGKFVFRGVDFFGLKGEALRAARREIQMIFQNPQGSLDPRQTARQVIQEPLAEHGLLPRGQIEARVEELMDQVGFNPALAARYAHQLSGGQCQRLAIARSLGLGAELLICDEPTSALDVSVQAQIINLLKDLQQSRRTTYLFISHNLAVVRQLATKVAVLYRGRIVESAPVAELFGAPKHPYTLELLGSESVEPARAGGPARPGPGEDLAISGLSSSGVTGCSFAARCPYAAPQCTQEAPQPELVAESHMVECHRWRAIEGAKSAPAST